MNDKYIGYFDGIYYNQKEETVGDNPKIKVPEGMLDAVSEEMPTHVIV